MIRREEISNPHSCLNRARDDEHVFVLLERDPAMAPAIRTWIEERIRLGKNTRFDPQICEAEQLICKLTGKPVTGGFDG